MPVPTHMFLVLTIIPPAMLSQNVLSMGSTPADKARNLQLTQMFPQLDFQVSNFKDFLNKIRKKEGFSRPLWSTAR